MPGVKRSKAERFRDDAKKRTDAVLVALRKLEGCGDRKKYAYTDEESAAIVKAVNDGVGRLADKFTDVEEPPRFEWNETRSA